MQSAECRVWGSQGCAEVAVAGGRRSTQQIEMETSRCGAQMQMQMQMAERVMQIHMGRSTRTLWTICGERSCSKSPPQLAAGGLSA